MTIENNIPLCVFFSPDELKLFIQVRETNAQKNMTQTLKIVEQYTYCVSNL